MAEEEVFKVLKTGKSKGKSWKRVITKPTFVGEGFTRRPVKVFPFIEVLRLDGTVYSTHGTENEESECHASGIGGDCSVSNYWGEEKS
jgi:hypothetical protein